MVTLLDPDDVVMDVGNGLAMDEALTAVGARVTGGGVDVGHGKMLEKGLTQVHNAKCVCVFRLPVPGVVL
jgi:hypothetical protein